MKVVALLSGGKDSCFSIMECRRHGHEVVAVANLYPPEAAASVSDDMDSWTFQTVGYQAIEVMARDCLELPLFRRPITGRNARTSLVYERTDEDEVEDMFLLLQDVVNAGLGVDAVCSGAILSDYQRLRVEDVCGRLGLTSMAYLWRRDQSQLLTDMVDAGLVAAVIKVAAMGLSGKHLGKTLGQLTPVLERLHTEFGCHVCGEGGEFETLTLDCPAFKRRLVLNDTQIVNVSEDEFAPVAYLRIGNVTTEAK